MSYLAKDPCPTCKSHERRPRGNCAECHRQAAARYLARKKAAAGSHTRAEWLAKASSYDRCAGGCNRPWSEVARPNSQKLPFTKGHIVALARGGRDDIGNLQPECASCNYARHGAHG